MLLCSSTHVCNPNAVALVVYAVVAVVGAEISRNLMTSTRVQNHGLLQAQLILISSLFTRMSFDAVKELIHVCELKTATVSSKFKENLKNVHECGQNEHIHG